MLEINPKAQRVMLWWSLAFMVIFGTAWGLLMRLLPLPPATLNADQVAAIYQNNGFGMRLGAVICSWVAAFMVPMTIVMVAQMTRLEKGFPIWSLLLFAGGIMMSIFLVLPPVYWGTAAFEPSRPAEITLLMHQFANLTLVTTDQYFIFQMVPVVAVAFSAQNAAHSAYPRWLGYLTVWVMFMLELGALGFMFRTGPFAWNGLFVFWCPLLIFAMWVFLIAFLMLRAIKAQEANGIN